ncbi:hypothetical protein QBC37DRAFT_296066 [Rhypophila decipiens]|uniref:DUF7708 domain-containing protein n=1 Tax=Rhypophila decipiens TaxID=261697 RepID=A0AAN6Y259_9PEZI|nr:hypothetical protein QBC37DRAFT_296066 [Rhypophila decipiens]
MSDVIQVLQAAQNKYGAKKAGRGRLLATATSWWQVASSRLMHYEKVIDTIVSSNPEYAAIVWGAFKFLFTATINHQELSVNIAQSLAEIGSVLPEIDFIATKLYPSELIRQTLARVYAYILEFCIRATKWCRDAHRNTIKKVFKSVFKPWALEFQDIRVNIDSLIKRLREQSAVAHQAETRDIHTRVIEIHKALDTVGSLQQTNLVGLACRPDPFPANPTMIEACPLYKERVSAYLSNIPFIPSQAIIVGSNMRDRRRGQFGTVPHKMWTNAQLQDWISRSTSAMVLLKGSGRRSEEMRDFALDLVQLLKQAGLPTIFYFGNNPAHSTATRMTTIDLIRSFISQVIELHEADLSSWSLSELDFHNCSSEDSWLRLLMAVLKQIPRLAIVLQVDDRLPSMIELLYHIWSHASNSNGITAVIKVLLIVRTTSDSSPMPAIPTQHESDLVHIVFEIPRGSQTAAVRRRVDTRRSRPSRFAVASRPQDFQPFLQQFVNDKLALTL